MVAREEYIFIDPMYSHDLIFPLLFARKSKRAVFCPEAIAFERSRVNLGDEKREKTKSKDVRRRLQFLFKKSRFLFKPVFMQL